MKYIYHKLRSFLALYLIVGFLLRISLGVESWLAGGGSIEIYGLLKAILTGLLYDLVVFAHIAAIFSLYFVILPKSWHGKRFDRYMNALFLGVFVYAICLSAVSEWLFWIDLRSRFNFIAVDYLVYTTEVLGNIYESYPVVWIFGSIFVLAVASAIWRYKHPIESRTPSFRARLTSLAIFIFIPCVAYFSLDNNLSDKFSKDFISAELGKNGTYSLFSHFLNNELNYNQFYVCDDEEQALEKTQKLISNEGVFLGSSLWRHVSTEQPENKRNVILVVVESFGADFLGALGNKEQLTPYMDELAKNSLFFTNLQATGTRTVYGLSAVTLSIPPVPGHAISRQSGAKDLFCIGELLKEKGYVSKFIYGGYGYFDNMNGFFKDNGYDIVDRTNLSDEEIHFSNIWGVCDEDLLDRVLVEARSSFQEENPFFFTVMTTSNHRPFTYPDGKIDIPSGSGRAGAVKYTDYALGKFLEKASNEEWFDNTLFVFVADHTAGCARKAELDIKQYHIPAFFYAPKFIKPKAVGGLCSQIDIPPTILGILDIDYDSCFLGKDLLREHPHRAFISNYQKVAYLSDDLLVVLKPVNQIDAVCLKEGLPEKVVKEGIEDAVAYYQTSSRWRELNKLHRVIHHQH